MTTTPTAVSRDDSDVHVNVTMTTQSMADGSSNKSTLCPRPCDCYNVVDTIDCSQRGLLQVRISIAVCQWNVKSNEQSHER